MNPTDKPTSVTIDGVPVKLYWNLNTFGRFEEHTGKFFLDWFFDVVAKIKSVAQDETLKAIREEAAALGIENSEERIEEIKQRISDIEEAMRKRDVTDRVMQVVGLKDFTAMLAAAWHTYDRDDNPRWGHTPGSLGRRLNIKHFSELLSPIISGITANLPGRDDAVKRIREDEPERPTNPTQQNPLPSGGEMYGPSDDAILASLMRE